VLTVVDHTEPAWQARYVRKGRENGAATYSREIVDHHVPAWAELDGDVVVGTCSPLTDCGPADLVVQYLHTYDKADPLAIAQRVARNLRGKAGRVLFITAYRSLQLQLQTHGLDAAFVPMKIDVAATRELAGHADPADTMRAVYFGNVTPGKRAAFETLSAALSDQGWTLDTISGQQRADALPAVAGYRYGVGVGRCALEMQALGLRVMVCGTDFGGIVTTPAEFEVQTATNWNARVVTYDNTVAGCLPAWDQTWTGDLDVSSAVAVVRQLVDEMR